MSPAKKANKAKKAEPAKRAGARGKKNRGSFAPRDPRINYAGRPPGTIELRAMMREMGEQKALNTLLTAMDARYENLKDAVRAADTWLKYANPELTAPADVKMQLGVSVRFDLSKLTDDELDLYERIAAKARIAPDSSGGDAGSAELPTGENAPEVSAQP